MAIVKGIGRVLAVPYCSKHLKSTSAIILNIDEQQHSIDFRV